MAPVSQVGSSVPVFVPVFAPVFAAGFEKLKAVGTFEFHTYRVDDLVLPKPGGRAV